MKKEIGSNFWLDTSQFENTRNLKIEPEDFNLKAEDGVLLSTGRSAITFAIRQIKKVKLSKKISALIPPYTCETVLQPFEDEETEINVYDIENDLSLTVDGLRNAIEDSDADIVLIHRYFGFDTTSEIKEVIREYQEKGVVFIEDRTQNLFSSFESLPVDYIVGSFRKWAAIPEGGYCYATNSFIDKSDKPELSDIRLVNAKLQAFQLKNDYMENDIGEKAAFMKAYAEAEHILDMETEFFKMSDESIKIIKQLDVGALKMKRRRNYRYVYEKLADRKDFSILTGKLREGDVPLYLALLTEKREQLQVWLREHNIYAPIVWPKPNQMPEVSDTVQKIYDQVICLPIDQRYELDDMERMVDLVRRFRG